MSPVFNTLALSCILCFSTVCLVLTDLAAATYACTNLTATLGTKNVLESGAQYSITANGTWSLFNSLDQPTCIVYPASTAHVQTAMTAIYETGSKYAVIAGGHSGMVGYNSITNGVLISFEMMQNVSYDASLDLVTVQPGVHWGNAINYLQSFGVAVLGGRAADVGTGLLLGGGISFLAPEYGWSADSLKEADVVLVDGSLITATATNQYHDLFRALKGGVNRFGIVTRYVLYPVHTGTAADKNWYSGLIVVVPGSLSAAVSNASAAFVRENIDPKASMMVIMNTLNLTAPDANIAYLFYHGASLPESIFGAFFSLPSTFRSLSPLSYADIAAIVDGSARGNGQQFGAAAFLGDEATFLEGYNHLVNFTTHYESQFAASFMVISPVPRSQWTVGKARGGNAIGDHECGHDFYPLYAAGVLAVLDDVSAGFDLLLSQVQTNSGLPLFINECDVSQNVFSTYPGYSTLKRTYAKYDPTRFVFLPSFVPLLTLYSSFSVRNTVGPVGL
ncbi:FAD-binding protein [Mycena venus]|uniref:FAD-binding protein n=1 Tax=Mycena venus TaxID=2733690 RepID=A0A8H7CJ59_9AGAR|nr:FAD-binding protein [Mycena venus]